MIIPTHIALILDGNGRWATERNLSRSEGHEAGFRNLIDIIEYANELKVGFLTCYAFSTENWNRPKAEVAYLMNIPVEIYKRESKRFQEGSIKVSFIGRRDRVPKKTLKAILQMESDTKDHTGIHVLIAFDYGGRDELLRGVQQLIDAGVKKVDETVLETVLDTSNVPDVDLLIRTSGEERISNFMLWQLAYAELYFTKTYWPAFGKQDLLQAIQEYNRRSRRFGGITNED